MPALQGNLTKTGTGIDLYEPNRANSHTIVAAGVATVLSGSAQVSVSNLSGVDANCAVIATGQFSLSGNPGYFVGSANTESITILYVNPASGALLTAGTNTNVFYQVLKPVS